MLNSEPTSWESLVLISDSRSVVLLEVTAGLDLGVVFDSRLLVLLELVLDESLELSSTLPFTLLWLKQTDGMRPWWFVAVFLQRYGMQTEGFLLLTPCTLNELYLTWLATTLPWKHVTLPLSLQPLRLVHHLCLLYELWQPPCWNPPPPHNWKEGCCHGPQWAEGKLQVSTHYGYSHLEQTTTLKCVCSMNHNVACVFPTWHCIITKDEGTV